MQASFELDFAPHDGLSWVSYRPAVTAPDGSSYARKPGRASNAGATSELARLDPLLFGGMWASPSFDETPTK